MKVLIVSQAEVSALLPMAACIEAMSDVLRALGRGEALLPLRQVIPLADGRGAFAVMPAVLGTDARRTSLAVKAITVPGQPRHPLRLPPGRRAAVRAGPKSLTKQAKLIE